MTLSTRTAGIIVRRIRPNDGQALRRLRLRALADSPSAFGSNMEREQAFAGSEWDKRAKNSASANLAATFLAEDAGGGWQGLVVVLGPLHPANHSQESAELVSMWVDPSVRKSGVGILLIEAAVAFATNVAASRVCLSLTQNNNAAHKLYLRFGFEEIVIDLPDNHCCASERRMQLRLPVASVRSANSK